MSIQLRRGQSEDASELGRIMFEAFASIAGRHNFPPDLPDVDTGVGLAAMLLSHPRFYGVVAEKDGRIVGSNFLDERSPIVGLGPITVDASAQDSGAGRMLMEHVLERARERNFPGVRLLQAAYHNRSLALYAKLGFDVREVCSILQGPPPGGAAEASVVRAGSADAVEACNRLCVAVHGHDRAGELSDAVQQQSLRVVERGGRITGYTTGVGFFGHSVGESNADLQALIATSEDFAGPGFILPARNTELLRWCLNRGLRIVFNMTLMTRGLYNEPRGAWLPSVLM